MLGMYPGDPGPLGGECAGTVVAVGEGVTELAVGDDVMALVGGSFRSHVVAPAALVVAKPAAADFEEAAGLLIAYVTAAFALDHLGRLARRRAGPDPCRRRRRRPGGGAARPARRRRDLRHRRERGQAGVSRLARGAPRLRLALARLRRRDSCRHRRRRCRRRPELARRRVRRRAASSSLRDGGRFLEIGKRDHLSVTIDRLDGRIAYHVIDWGETAQSDPQLIRGILLAVVEACADGSTVAAAVADVRVRRRPAAFRYMAQARHIGKVVVTQPAPPADQRPASIRPDGTYLDHRRPRRARPADRQPPRRRRRPPPRADGTPGAERRGARR